MAPVFHRSPFNPVLLSLAVTFWLGGASAVWAEQSTPDVRSGKAAYGQSCARCHGALGKGDGLDAKRFYPRPRDLSLGVYKFRSTASGTPPADEDLFHTITYGLPGSNMPDWQHLDEKTRWQLVAYLKSLSPMFAQAQPSPVAVSHDPGAAHTDLNKGKALYQQLGCAACHGSAGRANGTSAAGLMDDWGMPIRPADLTQGWSYRGGSDPRSVMLRVLTGIDGAGMPSYTGAVSPEDAWHLAYYVASLQEPAHWNLIAHVISVDGALPGSVDDPRWARVERTDVRLRNAVTSDGEWTEPPTVKAVSFQAIANQEAIAFRFLWDDPRQDPPTRQSDTAQPAGPQVPADEFALLLKPAGSQGDVMTLQAWPSRGAPRLDLCRWSAETGTASETIAADLERAGVTDNPQGLRASEARYEDGRWVLVLQRPLAPAAPGGAAAIAAEDLTSIAFVVWDGSTPKVRAVSPWVDITLGKRSTR